MTDLEMTRLCAEAMGFDNLVYSDGWPFTYREAFGSVAMADKYTPLTNDAQAMALVKKFRLFIDGSRESYWQVHCAPDYGSFNSDLNRAIVECVAKMRRKT